MTLRNGREFLSIPGPTTVPDEVLSAMHRPAVDIYSGGLPEMTDSCLSDLKKLFKTSGETFIYAANGHGAWEAALTNVLSRGDRVLVLESGRFALGWGEMGSVIGLDIEILPGSWRHAVDPDALTTRLKADTDAQIKTILVVQIDTATGVVNDIPAIRAAIDAAGHPALLMVDAIASLACMPFAMDDWGVDVTVSGCQKGLMTPPGLSFIAAGDKALAMHDAGNLRTHYWDWTFRMGDLHYMKYCGTPPEHLIFGLRKAMDMILDEGLEAIFERHRLLAGAVQAAAQVWARGGALELNIINANERAASVTTVLMNNPQPLLDYCRERCGVIVGIGIGEIEGKAFRVAHMGHVNAPMVLGTLSVIDMGLQALNIPHGKGGCQAAIDYLAAAVQAPSQI